MFGTRGERTGNVGGGRPTINRIVCQLGGCGGCGGLTVSLSPSRLISLFAPYLCHNRFGVWRCISSITTTRSLVLVIGFFFFFFIFSFPGRVASHFAHAYRVDQSPEAAVLRFVSCGKSRHPMLCVLSTIPGRLPSLRSVRPLDTHLIHKSFIVATRNPKAVCSHLISAKPSQPSLANLIIFRVW